MTVIRATVVVFLSALLSLSAFAESDLTMKTFGDRVIRELRETYSDRMYERLDAATINIIELDDKGRRSRGDRFANFKFCHGDSRYGC